MPSGMSRTCAAGTHTVSACPPKRVSASTRAPAPPPKRGGGPRGTSPAAGPNRWEPKLTDRDLVRARRVRRVVADLDRVAARVEIPGDRSRPGRGEAGPGQLPLHGGPAVDAH